MQEWYPEQDLDKTRVWPASFVRIAHTSGDLFDDEIQPDFFKKILENIRHHPKNTFELCTKHIHHMNSVLKQLHLGGVDELSNLNLGIVITDQREANRDIPALIAIPFGRKFIRCELSDRVDLGTWLSQPGNQIDSVICAGRTGKDAVLMHPDWVCSLRDQCRQAKVPFTFEGWGDFLPCSQVESLEQEEAFKRHQIENPQGIMEAESNLLNGITASGRRLGKEIAGNNLNCRRLDTLPHS